MPAPGKAKEISEVRVLRFSVGPLRRFAGFLAAVLS